MVRKKSLGFFVILLLFASIFGTTFNVTTIAEDTLNPPLYQTQTLYDGWYNKPSTYSQLVSWYQNLTLLYPNYIELFKANVLYGTGTITGGYDTYYIRITNESLGLHKPEVLFLGGPHGDETVGTIGMYWFTDWLMRHAFDPNYNTSERDWLRWLLDNREIYFEASHNPYGFDHGPQRYDGNGWDLNREADYDGPGSPTGGIWGSVNGKTLYRFLNNHTILVGCDFHGGARCLLYPWSSNHDSVYGTSPISGETYSHAPPDFYYFDASSLRLGDYIGDYGGNLDEDSIGTVPDTIGYEAMGAFCPWGYGADVIKNPVEDPFVMDETFGNYPGAGVLWVSPEMSNTKNPSQTTFGNDTTLGWGMEIRRYILHQTDIAQPYIWFLPGTTLTDSVLSVGDNVTLKWEVNGCLVVDHTHVQWGENPDPITNPLYVTPDYDDHAGDYVGGTGWDNATNGVRNGVAYTENIALTEPGEYYFVVKAQVDQIYNATLAPSIYGLNHSYLRLVKQRVNESYYEQVNGTDGLEIIEGQTWWYSPVIHVSVDPGAVTHDFSLKEGWNLVSIPVDTVWTAEELGDNITDCTVVIKFDSGTQTFMTHVVGTPWDNFPIEEGVGYFVYLTSNETFTAVGWPIAAVSIPLYPGWNIIGWYQGYNTTAESLGDNITGCSTVLMFDAPTQAFLTHVVDTPWDNFVVTRGMGLFLYTTTAGTWQGEG